VLKLIHAFFVFVTHVFKPHQDIYCTTSSFHLYFTSTSIFTFVFFFYFTFLPYFAITSSSTSVPMHAYPPNFSYCTALHCTALHCTVPMQICCPYLPRLPTESQERQEEEIQQPSYREHSAGRNMPHVTILYCRTLFHLSYLINVESLCNSYPTLREQIPLNSVHLTFIYSPPHHDTRLHGSL
jgi:hypothetical protein